MPAQETPIEKLRRKVELLIRHSKGTNNEKEARIFAQKAEELIAEHGLDKNPDPVTPDGRPDLSGAEAPPRPQKGTEGFDEEVYDIGSSRMHYVALFRMAADYFNCIVTFIGRYRGRKARVYGSRANRRQLFVMYEFWKLECLEAAKEFKEEHDRLYYPDAPWLVYGPIQAQQVMFDEVTAMLYREICRPKILSQGRALNPFLVEPEKRVTVTKEVNGKLVEKKEWVPDEEGDMFPYIEWCNSLDLATMPKRAPLTMQLPAGSDNQSPKQIAETMRIARTKEVS